MIHMMKFVFPLEDKEKDRMTTRENLIIQKSYVL